MRRAMVALPSGRTTGDEVRLYPFWGVFKRFCTGQLTRVIALPNRISAIYWYASSLGVAVPAVAALFVQHGAGITAPWWALIALVAIAIAAERQSVQVGSNTQMSVAALPIIFAAVVYGPLTAMIVGGLSVVCDYGRPHARFVIWTFSRALAAGVAGGVVLLLPPYPESFGLTLAAVAAAAAGEGICDALLVSITVKARRTAAFRVTLISMGRLLLSTIPLYAPVVAALAFAYTQLSPWSVLLFFVPTLAAQRLLRLYQDQRELTDDLRAINTRLERANVAFAGGLVAALDARDRYTAGHSAAVAIYARDIASRLGLSRQEQDRAHLSGLLHDVGKVGLPPAILEKEGPLTLDERRAMEEHSTIGERILANADDYAEIARVVRHHHERMDGTGYPDRLPATSIPLLSRIIAVADAYNAMTSGRPYRDAMPVDAARDRLRAAAGSQFDPTVVAVFDSILETASKTYLTAARADFAIEVQKAQSRQRPSLETAA